jgi:hypothetical protein
MVANARFWTMTPSADWVKITLKSGQTLTHSRFRRHEEGWSRESVLFRHEGDHVLCQSSSDGIDCDGRLQSFSDTVCPLSQLNTRMPHPDFADELPPGAGLPEWERRSASQRDFSAEAMGY